MCRCNLIPTETKFDIGDDSANFDLWCEKQRGEFGHCQQLTSCESDGPPTWNADNLNPKVQVVPKEFAGKLLGEYWDKILKGEAKLPKEKEKQQTYREKVKEDTRQYGKEKNQPEKPNERSRIKRILWWAIATGASTGVAWLVSMI